MDAYQTYGIMVGQVYEPADGSYNRLTVVDVETHRDCDDVIVYDEGAQAERRIDCFKLAMVRYRLTSSSTCASTDV